MSVDVGSKAPDFTLMSHDRQPITLSAQHGHPVVLAFFPAAFSSVCQKELCTFRDQLARLVPRGFVRSALAILLVNTLFDLVA